MDLDPRAVQVLVGEFPENGHGHETAIALTGLIYEAGRDLAGARRCVASGWLHYHYDESVADATATLLEQVAGGTLHGRDGVQIGDAPCDITTTVFTAITITDPCGYLRAAAGLVVERAAAEHDRRAEVARAAGVRIERSTTCQIGG